MEIEDGKKTLVWQGSCCAISWQRKWWVRQRLRRELDGVPAVGWCNQRRMWPFAMTVEIGLNAI
jgi:hypothetical protein